MAAPQKPFGFTLIELMITIAVLVILVTLAAPAFNLAEQRRVIGAAESALDQIQTARSEAIKQGRDIHFVSQGDGDTWCHGISNTPTCDCTVDDAAAANACTIVMAGDEDAVLRTTSSDDFRNVSMTGEQTLTFNHVRGTVERIDSNDDPEPLVFTSAPNDFGMQVQLNLIGRPRACGTNRALGAYNQCPGGL
ncbi:Tfp pilus assembly protein FimT/FimU [Thioalkalivibrio sp. ALE28]|uniref:pilus assembly FimT family protein n=1 Tax=Thioalkalivibrio sp. ALE28 TaxID=1158179 RepID=UPI00037A345C|nr:GspH/FimT family pseudopilin [Thioalkalivibrio sp. ALE28]